MRLEGLSVRGNHRASEAFEGDRRLERGDPAHELSQGVVFLGGRVTESIICKAQEVSQFLSVGVLLVACAHLGHADPWCMADLALPLCVVDEGSGEQAQAQRMKIPLFPGAPQFVVASRDALAAEEPYGVGRLEADERRGTAAACLLDLLRRDPTCKQDSALDGVAGQRVEEGSRERIGTGPSICPGPYRVIGNERF